MMTDRPLLCVVHVPKTAGSAIRETLHTTIGADKIYWIGHRRPYEHWEEAAGEEFDNFWVVGGHRETAAFDKIKRPKIFMAVLRDPVQRAISLFNFIRDGKGEPHPLREKMQTCSVLAALEQLPSFRNDVSNFQCQLIGGERTYGAALRSLCDRRWVLGRHEDVNKLFADVCDIFGWPRVQLKLDNAAEPGYETKYYTQEIVSALAAINREDDRLLNLFRAQESVAYVGGPSPIMRRTSLAREGEIPPLVVAGSPPASSLAPNVARAWTSVERGLVLFAKFALNPGAEPTFFVNRPVLGDNVRLSLSSRYLREVIVSYLLNPDYYHLTSGEAWLTSGEIVCALQIEDQTEDRESTFAYSGDGDRTTLIPDVQFWTHRGYFALRREIGRLATPWNKRRPVALWRGTTTGPTPLDETTLPHLPRFALCAKALAFRDICDAKLTGVVQAQTPEAGTRIKAACAEIGVLAPPVPQIDFLNYRYQINIDGNSNAWGLLPKLLMGSCVLMVASRWRQWYYDDMRPWEHYVPVAADLSDLEERVRWCIDHDEEARAIGEAGQRLAEHLVFGTEMIRFAGLIACHSRSADMLKGSFEAVQAL